LDALISVRSILTEALPGEELYGFTAAAGLPLGFYQSTQKMERA